MAWTSLEGVAEIRSAIYERTSAGLRFDRVYEMARRDTHGFLRVLGIGVVSAITFSMVAGIFAIIVFLEFMPAIITASYNSDATTLVSIISGSIVILLMTCAVFGFILALLVNLARMLCLTATALWMRQFNVPLWGRSEDPLPGESMVDDRPVSPYEDARPSDSAPVMVSESVKQTTDVRREVALPVSQSTAESNVSSSQATPSSYEGLIERVRHEVEADPVDERGVDELTGVLEAMIEKNDVDLHDMQ
jgi:hypothetical protein